MSIRRKIRASLIGTWLFDEAPMRARQMETRAWVPRRLGLLSRDIYSNEEFRRECEESYGHYPGGDVIDVGAAWGAYCFALAPKAKKGAKFMALEPSKAAFNRLLANLAALQNMYPEILFQPLLLAAGDGNPAEFEFPMGENYHPRVVSKPNGSGRGLTVDDLVLTFGLSPSFIKADVEGAEGFVLNGMTESLKKFRPVVMLELHPLFQPEGYSIEGLIAQMQSFSYTQIHSVADPAAIRTLWKPSERVT